MRTGRIKAFRVSSRLFRLTGFAAPIQVSLLTMTIAVAFSPTLKKILPVRVPPTDVQPATAASTRDQLLVSIRDEGIRLDGEVIPESRLIEILSPRLKKRSVPHVFLDVDPDMTWDKVVYFMDALHRAGAESIGLTPDLKLWLDEHAPTPPPPQSTPDAARSTEAGNASQEDSP